MSTPMAMAASVAMLDKDAAASLLTADAAFDRAALNLGARSCMRRTLSAVLASASALSRAEMRSEACARRAAFSAARRLTRSAACEGPKAARAPACPLEARVGCVCCGCAEVRLMLREPDEVLIPGPPEDADSERRLEEGPPAPRAKPGEAAPKVEE